MSEGAAPHRAGKPEVALDKLLPRRGKGIDGHARMFLNDERSTSAMGASGYGQAITSMLAWLHEAGVKMAPKSSQNSTILPATFPWSNSSRSSKDLAPKIQIRQTKNLLLKRFLARVEAPTLRFVLPVGSNETQKRSEEVAQHRVWTWFVWVQRAPDKP